MQFITQIFCYFSDVDKDFALLCSCYFIIVVVVAVAVAFAFVVVLLSPSLLALQVKQMYNCTLVIFGVI